jgi:hypothetical protein
MLSRKPVLVPLVVPMMRGFSCLLELDAVPWQGLAHAYSGNTKVSLEEGHVDRALLALGHPDAERREEAAYALHSNVLHQGTVYPATAYAVPFLISMWASSEVPPETREHIADLVAGIAAASTVIAPTSCHSGSVSEDVAQRIREALSLMTRELEGLALEPQFARLVGHIRSAAHGERAGAEAIWEELYGRR